MVDFIKMYYGNKDRFEPFILDERNFVNIKTNLDYHSGVISYPFTTKLGSLDVGVSEKSGYAKNSLHKLYNFLQTGKPHNYDDFEFSKLSGTIDFVIKKLVDSDLTKITQLEFGLNIEINKLPENVIKRNFFFHNFKGGISNDFRGTGQLKQFNHSNYLIKIYDKSKQYKLNTNLLRFEIKFVSYKEIQLLGVFNIVCLKNKIVLRKLFVYMIKRYDELVVVDDFDEHSISNIEDYYKLVRYTNHNYWNEEIKGAHPQFKAREKYKFKSLLEKYDLLKTKNHIRVLLFQKFIYLINN